MMLVCIKIIKHILWLIRQITAKSIMSLNTEIHTVCVHVFYGSPKKWSRPETTWYLTNHNLIKIIILSKPAQQFCNSGHSIYNFLGYTIGLSLR